MVQARQSKRGESVGVKDQAASRISSAAELRRKVNTAVKNKVSTKSVGLESGTDEAALRVVPDHLYTDEMQTSV